MISGPGESGLDCWISCSRQWQVQECFNCCICLKSWITVSCRVCCLVFAPLNDMRTLKFKAQPSIKCSAAPLASDYRPARGNQIVERSSDNEKILCARVNFASTAFVRIVFNSIIRLFAVDFCEVIVDEGKCRVKLTSQKSTANFWIIKAVVKSGRFRKSKHSPVVGVPTEFFFFPNVHSCFYNSIFKQKTFQLPCICDHRRDIEILIVLLAPVLPDIPVIIWFWIPVDGLQ